LTPNRQANGRVNGEKKKTVKLKMRYNGGEIGLQLPRWFRIERKYSVITDGTDGIESLSPWGWTWVNGQKTK
jgi:hypothetical protein